MWQLLLLGVFQISWISQISFSEYPTESNVAVVKVAKNIDAETVRWLCSALLKNYKNTPQQGHSYFPGERMMNRRTRTLLPASKTALLPLPIDVNNTKQQIINKRIVTKVIYDRKAGSVHSKPAIGTYPYAKPLPQKWGSLWIYGQITDSGDQSYTLKIPNNTTIQQNRVYITPAFTSSKPLIIRTPVLVHPQTLHRQQTLSQTKISINSLNETMQITTEQSTAPAPPPPPKSAVDSNIQEQPKRIIKLPSRDTDYYMS